MKNLPGHLNKLKKKAARWDELQEIEEKSEAELVAESLLRQKMDLTPENFELEAEIFEDAQLIVHPKRETSPHPKPYLTDFQRQLNDIAHEMKLHKPPLKKKRRAKKQPADRELSLLEKRIANLKKEIKSRISSIESKKMKLANYKEKSPTSRPKGEMKKIAKRAQTNLIKARFASKKIDGKAKRTLISKTLTKEQTLKKMKKKVAITRDPPPYH